ncbi:TetR/AcrR family transcriptional regulator [Haliangium sp.]|uniref:TetR/AcrR family transcriptional regulator n=2 Tax=Haliangium sp. TaxID=2663208 RepID=UPI003D13A661
MTKMIAMGRWEPDARGRLVQAALELYRKRGFEQTTVAEIAGLAGLTERTFFRHFADKREVLFSGTGELQQLLVDNLVAAPDATSPMDAVVAALDAVAAEMEQRRDLVLQRQAIIAATAELQERELLKLAALAVAMAEALRRRGVNDPAAALAAEAGIAVFKVAFERWIDEAQQQPLSLHIRNCVDELKAVAAGESRPAPPSTRASQTKSTRATQTKSTRTSQAKSIRATQTKSTRATRKKRG